MVTNQKSNTTDFLIWSQNVINSAKALLFFFPENLHKFLIVVEVKVIPKFIVVL